MSQRLKILFTVSVLLNVVLVGVLCGMSAKHWRGPDWENIPPETRHLMAKTFQKTHADMRSVHDEARKARKEMMKVWGREEFDEAAYKKAAEKYRKARTKMTERKIDSLQDMVSELAPEERKAVAEQMSKMFDKKRYGRHGSPLKHYDHPKKPDAGN